MNNHIRNTLFVVFLLPVISNVSYAQKLPAGPQVLTFFSDCDDTEQPYGLYLPKNYDPKKKYPLVIMLHGAGSNHRLALRRVFGKSNANGENDVEASRYFPEWKDVEYIVASPYARGTTGYQGVAEKDVYDVLADVKKRFNVDEDRTYLTGLSMGGGGTLWIGLTRPDVWAALAPVCAAPPNGTDVFVPNALNVPMYFFHGDADPAVPVTRTRDMVKRLKESGTNVSYTEYPGVGHNSWEKAYADEAIFDWFSKFKRNRFPNEVRFVSNRFKYNKAYWVELDALTPGTSATIDAKFVKDNELEITTSGLDAFTLNVNGHPQFKSGQPAEIILDGKKLKGNFKDAISFTKKDGKWVSEKYQPAAMAKKAGAEGPLTEAFAGRHVYVYGTAGNPSEEELKARMETATQAADWSVYRGWFLGRVMFFPRIVADKDVKQSDLEEANLILFGTKETNTLVDKFSERLPLQLNSNAKDYGLFYVFPNNGHYVAISSGLPWWTGAQGPFMLPQITIGKLAMDYVLFKDSIDNKIVEGNFDNNWKMPAGDGLKLKGSGVVTLNEKAQ